MKIYKIVKSMIQGNSKLSRKQISNVIDNDIQSDGIINLMVKKEILIKDKSKFKLSDKDIVHSVILTNTLKMITEKNAMVREDLDLVRLWKNDK